MERRLAPRAMIVDPGLLGVSRIPRPTAWVEYSVSETPMGVTVRSTLDRALNDALVASLGQRDFLPAAKFLGARHGAVFKTGTRGLGYYRDEIPEVDTCEAPRAFWKDAKLYRPVVITLDDLLCVDIEAEEHTHRRQRAKRIRKRHRGRRAVKS